MSTLADPTMAEPERPPGLTDAEREVADLLPIGADPASAKAAIEEVPFWFHTFSLDGGSLYTPGVARDHRYRIPAFPEDLTGEAVLDVGAFDGFYSFLAEARGAERIVAVDNEQYVEWVRARWGTELSGGEGLRAIARLLDSRVEYRRLDAFDLDALGETFDLIICFGILHRVSNPLGLLEVLRGRLGETGRVLLETYGVRAPELEDKPAIHVCEPGEVYANDEFVFWAFSGESIARLARLAGFAGLEIADAPVVDGHPRIIGTLFGTSTVT